MSYQVVSTVKTGRKRTLKMSGSWSGSGQVVSPFGHYPFSFFGDASSTGHCLTLLQAQYWGLNFLCSGVPDLSLGADYGGFLPSPYGGVSLSVGWDIALQPYLTPITAFGAVDSAQVLDTHSATTYDSSGSGTWLFEVDVEEYYDVQQEIDDNTGLPVFPSYGGKMQQEPPYSNKVVFYELTKPGGIIHLTSTYMAPGGNFVAHGNTFSVDIKAYVNYAIPVIYVVGGLFGCAALKAGYATSSIAFGGKYNSTISANMSAVFDNTFSQYALTNSFDSLRDGAGVGDLTGTYSTDGLTHQMSVTSNTSQRNPSGQVWHTVFFALSLAKIANVSVGVFADKNPYQDQTACTVRGDKSSDVITVGNGVGSKTITQGFVTVLSIFEFKASYVYKQPAKTVAYDTRQALSCYMNPGSQIANREDTDDWRMMWKGLLYPSFTLQQKTSLPVDDASALVQTNVLNSMPGGWSASTPAMITQASSTLTIVVADGRSLGTANRSFNDYQAGVFVGACFGGYRYLVFNIRGTAEGLPFRVRLTNQDGNKYWDMVTGAKDTYSNVTVDLCNPHSITNSTDSTDSMWPFVGDEIASHIKDGDYTGVTAVSSLSLENLGNVQTYDIKSITLSSLSNPLISIAPAFKNMLLEVDGDALSNLVRVRTVGADTDGRQSLEATDLKQDVLGNLNIISLDGLRQNCNLARNGWSAVAAPKFPDSYHTNSLDGVYLWGGGVIIGKIASDTVSKFRSGFDRV